VCDLDLAEGDAAEAEDLGFDVAADKFHRLSFKP
jgi:hypothetical protein